MIYQLTTQLRTPILLKAKKLETICHGKGFYLVFRLIYFPKSNANNSNLFLHPMYFNTLRDRYYSNI